VTSYCVCRDKATCTIFIDSRQSQPAAGVTRKHHGMQSRGGPTGLLWLQGLEFMVSLLVSRTSSASISTWSQIIRVKNLKKKLLQTKLMSNLKYILFFLTEKWLRCLLELTSLYRLECAERITTTRLEAIMGIMATHIKLLII
jgi:hypothetical protein